MYKDTSIKKLIKKMIYLHMLLILFSLITQKNLANFVSSVYSVGRSTCHFFYFKTEQVNSLHKRSHTPEYCRSCNKVN